MRRFWVRNTWWILILLNNFTKNTSDLLHSSLLHTTSLHSLTTSMPLVNNLFPRPTLWTTELICFRKLDSRAIIKSTSAVLGTFRPFSPKARSVHCLSLRKVYPQSAGTCVLRSVHSLQGPSSSANFPTTLSAMYPAMYTSTFPSWSKAGDDCTEGLVSRSRTTSGGSVSEVRTASLL